MPARPLAAETFSDDSRAGVCRVVVQLECCYRRTQGASADLQVSVDATAKSRIFDVTRPAVIVNCRTLLRNSLRQGPRDMNFNSLEFLVLFLPPTYISF